jgi:glutathione S-transferase
MTIELYVFPPSPRSFKVMAIANYLGFDWTPRFVDLAKGDQKTPQYAALNPNMLAPTLKDGDYVLWESNAIGQYMASKRAESGLMLAAGSTSRAGNFGTSRIGTRHARSSSSSML